MGLYHHNLKGIETDGACAPSGLEKSHLSGKLIALVTAYHSTVDGTLGRFLKGKWSEICQALNLHCCQKFIPTGLQWCILARVNAQLLSRLNEFSFSEQKVFIVGRGGWASCEIWTTINIANIWMDIFWIEYAVRRTLQSITQGMGVGRNLVY